MSDGLQDEWLLLNRAVENRLPHAFAPATVCTHPATQSQTHITICQNSQHLRLLIGYFYRYKKVWQMKKLYPFLLLLSAGLQLRSQEDMITVAFQQESGNITRFAESELRKHLRDRDGGYPTTRIAASFKRDKSLVDGTFEYRIDRKGKHLSLGFIGGDETTITHAVHGFLEHIGFRFSLDGTIRPDKIRLDTLTAGHYRTTPFVRWRGIRQHVNFPMDISSYPIEEAKEYVERLMRMRFNKLAVHSYPNLWHEVRTGDSIEYAGNFFYNREHAIPGYAPISKNIRFNQKIFSIPAIEPYYHDRKTRSRMSVEWMRALLTHAKSIGLNIQFSVEPRTRGDIDYIVDNCRSALTDYPMIDELEIITEELGGWGNACSDSTVRNVLKKRFGAGILNDTMVTGVIRKNQPDLDNLFDQLGRNIAALKIIEKDPWFMARKKGYKLGVYCTLPAYADAAYHIVRTTMPHTEVTIMPGHGSVRTADHFSRVRKTAADLAMTTVFSWIEFDGLMFTQQNPIAGIESLMRHLDAVNRGHQQHSVLFNHWRTAENGTAGRYAAVTTLYGPMEASDFYMKHAAEMGIQDPKTYASVMKMLEDIDKRSTNDLPNVGFCWIGAWLQGAPYTWMDRNMLQLVMDMFDSTATTVEALEKNTLAPSGKQHLAFLGNRLRASVSYLSAFRIATGIQLIPKNGAGGYDEAESKKAAEICNNALLEYERYITLHTRMMPDRGCEGTLINLWHGPMYGVRVLRERIGKIPMDTPVKAEKSTDAPPLPILMKKQ